MNIMILYTLCDKCTWRLKKHKDIEQIKKLCDPG